MLKFILVFFIFTSGFLLAEEPDVTWYGEWGLLKSNPREGFYPRNLIGFSKDEGLKVRYYCASDSESGFKISKLSLLLQDEMVIGKNTSITVSYETDVDEGSFIVSAISTYDKKTVSLDNLHLWGVLKSSSYIRFSIEGYNTDTRSQSFKFKYLEVNLDGFNYAVSETNKSCRL